MSVGVDKQLKILIMRFHAFGDLVAILPYVNALRQKYPNAQIDLLTADRVRTIPENLVLFDRVIGIWGGMHAKKLFLGAMMKLPSLLFSSYDKVIDLQNDRKSKLLKWLLGHQDTVAFDAYGSRFAGLRYQQTIQDVGFETTANFNLVLKSRKLGLDALKRAGWDERSKLIALNPAGFYITRNWPLAYYKAFIELLEKELQGAFNIVFIGDNRIAKKAKFLTAAFPNRCLNLVNSTTQLEAFASLSHLHFMLTEDSGLAHMAWVQGVKICLMLGSTRADWTAPPYDHVINLTSSDLECGDCMQATCKHGDVRCLTRYTPEYIFGLIKKHL